MADKTPPMERFLDALTAKGCAPKAAGEGKWVSRCPAHDDQHPSLSIAAGDDGRVLVHCHAGCTAAEVCTALGMKEADLFTPKARPPARRMIKTYNYCDAGDRILFQVCRYEPKAFHQRRPDGHGGWIWNVSGVPRVLYHLPQLAKADPKEPVFIVEGEKDADVLASIGVLATTNPGGAGKWKKLSDDSVLRSRRVFIITDKDDTGREHAVDVAARLFGKAAEVRVLELPGEGVKDAADWVVAQDGQPPERVRAALLALAEAAPAWTPPENTTAEQGRPRRGCAPRASLPAPARPGLPQIVLHDVQLNDLTAQALAALRRANSPPAVFVRSGSLCRVIRDEDGQPSVEAIDKARMRARLADVAAFFSINKRGEFVGANPPLYLAENILAQGAWEFPALVGVARSPILRPNGTICTAPGYDPDTRLCYCPDPGLVVPPIPENPSADEIEAARDNLIELIAEFPFADSASLANSLAILFSILMRPVIAGHVPLAIVDAPVQGTGKTLMATVLGIVGVGAVSGESIPDRQNDDEWRKKITAILLKGPPLVLLDNIPDNSTIDAAPLVGMLTTHLWSDRLLGKNENVQLPARAVWVATGNNLRVSGDMPRRSYTVRMDANSERPWARTGFRHPDLEQYAQTNRGRLLAAAFTLIRAWYAAGRPKADVPTFGSFQEWADSIGGVLAHAGVAGFLDNLEQVRAVQDEDTLQWQAFFAAWWEQFGDAAVTADDLVRLVVPRKDLYDSVLSAPLVESLPEPLLVNKDRGEGSLKRSIGRNLSRLTGRIFEGRKLCDAGIKTHRKVRAWHLQSTGRPFAGLVTPQANRNPATNPAEEDEQ